MFHELKLVLAVCSVCVVSGVSAQDMSGFGVSPDNGSFSADSRRIVRGNTLLPDTSFYIPNSFPSSSVSRYYGFIHGISRVRKTSVRAGCEPDCSDAIVYLEADAWKDDQQSFTGQLSVHSLSGRNGGTTIGEGVSLGFKYAKRINGTSAFSVSGEHAIQLDRTVDLGRNIFVGYSKFLESKNTDRFSRGFLFNVGLGTGLYTVYDNWFIETGELFGGNNIAGDRDKLTWGFVGSVSFYYSHRVALGAEFTGYGFGAGISLKPFKNLPLTATGYLYDLINDFPEGIPCAESPCQPRFYGRLSYSF